MVSVSPSQGGEREGEQTGWRMNTEENYLFNKVVFFAASANDFCENIYMKSNTLFCFYLVTTIIKFH